jgi:hypothetical protein
MGARFIGADREQPFLLPPAVTDWVPEDHLVWTVLEAVGELDLALFYADYRAWFQESTTERDRDGVKTDAVSRGGHVEWSSDHLLAIDAGDAVVGEAIVDVLAVLEESGRLTWEAGQ